MMLPSWGPLGSGIGGLLRRLGGLLGGLGAILGVLERSFSDSGTLGPSWRPLGAFLARLGALLGPKQSSDTPRQGTRDLAIWAPGPLSIPQE